MTNNFNSVAGNAQGFFPPQIFCKQRCGKIFIRVNGSWLKYRFLRTKIVNNIYNTKQRAER